jgi:hypothetical protein
MRTITLANRSGNYITSLHHSVVILSSVSRYSTLKKKQNKKWRPFNGHYLFYILITATGLVRTPSPAVPLHISIHFPPPAYSFILRMEAEHSWEISINSYRITPSNIAEGSYLHSHRRENLRPRFHNCRFFVTHLESYKCHLTRKCVC